jgi:hypothetical protein
MAKYRPLIIVAALVALFGALWRRRVDSSRPVDHWEPVKLS